MIRFLRNAVLLFHLVILGFRVISALAVEEDSWPMQYALVDDRSNDRYIHFMQGCYQTYGKTLCDANERDRIALNLHQPAWQTNFTSTGYVKARLSDAAFLLFQDFWDLHSCETQHLRKEAWNRGSIYVNHWEASTKLLFLDDPEIGMSVADRTFLQQEVQSVLSKWSGTSLTPSWFYGIRVYQKGSIVAPHVDRLPLVISAIINVAQDVEGEEDWPLQIIGHDGIAVNITMQPGDMVLYESHSVLHGRPYPLQGNYYANVLVHFEPEFYTMNLERELLNNNNNNKSSQENEAATLREKFEQALLQWDDSNDHMEETKRQDLPLHIEEGSLEAIRWRQHFAFVKEEQEKKSNNQSNNNKMHNINRLAARGALDSIQELAETNPTVLQQRDANGWQPIHEAARAGQTQVMEYLVQKGVDLNTRTNNGNGGTPLWWAEHMLPNHHKTIQLLRDNGAVSIAPGVKIKSEKQE